VTGVVVGLGARRGATAADLRAAVDVTLAGAGLAAVDVTILATVDRRAGAHAVRTLVLDLGCLLVTVPAAELARQAVPHPSATVAAAVGTPSVAEAAALVAAGSGAELLVPKRVFPGVTVAIARGLPGT
jgi:cobalamin biosynthesis protein CbiG